MIEEIRQLYLSGKIDKHKYVKDAYQIHKYLHEFSNFVSLSKVVKKIEITEREVVFFFDINGKEIKLLHPQKDMYSVPLILFNFGTYESNEYKLAEAISKDCDVIFDIGANIGWYSINLYKNLDKAKIYSFEPVPNIFNTLKRNFELNDIDCSGLFNIGFYSENTELKMNYYPEWEGASSISNNIENMQPQVVCCSLIKLDDFVSDNNITKIDFIKCDVEGAELHVFKGAERTLREHKPIVFSEMLRKWAKKFNYHPNDIIKFFSDLGYSCYTINSDRLVEFEFVTDETIETNYFFLHRSKHLSIIRKFSN